MRIVKIDEALDRCTAHLSTKDTTVNAMVEDLLVQSLLILIYAEFERTFRTLILERCSRVEDEVVRLYLDSSVKSVFRSLQLGDISGFLARFGPSYRDEFSRRLEQNGEARQMYDNIRTNRNLVAHGDGSYATLADVKQFYEGGHVVLDYFRDTLWNDRMNQ